MAKQWPNVDEDSLQACLETFVPYVENIIPVGLPGHTACGYAAELIERLICEVRRLRKAANKERNGKVKEKIEQLTDYQRVG